MTVLDITSKITLRKLQSSGQLKRITGDKRFFPGPFKEADILKSFRGSPHENIATDEDFSRRLRVLLSVESTLSGVAPNVPPVELTGDIDAQASFIFSCIGPDVAYSIYLPFSSWRICELERVKFGSAGDYKGMIREIRNSGDILFVSDSKSGFEFLGIPFQGRYRGRDFRCLGTLIMGTHQLQGKGNRDFFVESDIPVMRAFAEVASMVLVSAALKRNVTPEDAFTPIV